MVGTLIKLKYKTTWNELSRSTSRLIGTLVSLAGGVGVLFLVVVSFLSAAAFGQMPLVAQMLPLAGSVIVAGWVIAPIFLASLDSTIDVPLFANTNAPDRKLAFAFLIAQAVSGTGIVFLGILLLPTVGWLLHGEPLPAFFALLGSALGFIIMVAASRVAMVYAARFVESSRARRSVINMIFFVLVMVFFMTWGYWITALLDSGIGIYQALAGASGILNWSPLGAPFAVSYYAGNGQWALASLCLAISTLTAGLLIWWWVKLLPAAMTGKAKAVPNWQELYRQQQSQADSRSEYRSHTQTERFLPATDWFYRLGLSPATSGTAARSLRYWLKDPRYSMGIILPFVFLIGAYAMLQMNLTVSVQDNNEETADALNWVVYYLLVFAFSGMGFPSLVDTSMDSTAFWHHATSGMRGAADRLGRLLGALIWQIPYTLLLAAVAFFLFNLDLVALWVISLPLLLTLHAIGLLISARFVYPSPAPGSNGLSKNGAGSTGWQALVQMGAILAVALLSSPIWLSYLFLVFHAPTYTWVCVPVSLVLIALYLWTGVTQGGKILERNWTKIISEMRTWPGHSL